MRQSSCNIPDWLMGLPGMLLSTSSSAFLALPSRDAAFTGVACKLAS